MEIFPTIEVIDRTYAPVDQQVRFAIPLELDLEDINLALQGKFVTRVIYLEDPHKALPTPSVNGQSWFEVGPGRDPLAVADELGRPVAILRMGARVPERRPGSPILLWLSALGKLPAADGGQARPVRETAPPRPAAPAQQKPQHDISHSKPKMDASLAAGDYRRGHVDPLLLPRSCCALRPPRHPPRALPPHRMEFPHNNPTSDRCRALPASGRSLISLRRKRRKAARPASRADGSSGHGGRRSGAVYVGRSLDAAGHRRALAG